MLNYAYAVLEGQVRIELVRAGFDVTIGFLHGVKQDRPALMLDVLEPARTVADRAVLNFVREQVFSPADFMLTSNGVVRLHPQLAREVVNLLNFGTNIKGILTGMNSKVPFRPNLEPSPDLAI